MRCSRRIQSKPKHFFSYAHFFQVQNQSVWKVCAPLPGQKRIMCLPIDQGDAESSGMTILQGRETLGSQKPIKCTSNWFPTSRNSFPLWKLGASLFHESLLIFSSSPKTLQNCFSFSPQPLTPITPPSPSSSRSHHLAASIVLIIIRFPSPTASAQRPYWIQSR